MTTLFCEYSLKGFSYGLLNISNYKDIIIRKDLKNIQEENFKVAARDDFNNHINLNNEIGQLAVDVTDLTNEIDDYLEMFAEPELQQSNGMQMAM